MSNPCKVCGKEDAKKCGKCHRVFYCSVECQRQDWKSHKKTCSSSLQRNNNNNSDEPSRTIFGEPFTLDKFIPHLKNIKRVTKRCANMWVDLRMAGNMPVDSSLPTCFVYFTSEGFVCEHMVFLQEPPPLQILQQIIDHFQAHAVSMSVEMRYRNPQTMAVMKEGVVLQVSAKGYEKKFFFDQTRGGRSEAGVLLSVSDPEECHISLFDSARIEFHWSLFSSWKYLDPAIMLLFKIMVV